MKKFFALLLSAVMVFSLAACSGSNGNTPETSAASSTETTDQAPAAESSEEPGGETAEGKTLVVYFSATNNTERIAGYIAEATGADLFELVPVEPYSSDDLDWTDEDSRVSREHDDESLRVVDLENASPFGGAMRPGQ